MQPLNNASINPYFHPFQYVDNKVDEIKKADFSSNPTEAKALSTKYMAAMICTGLVAAVALIVAIAVGSPFIALAISAKAAIAVSGLVLTLTFATISAQMGKFFIAYGSHDSEEKRTAAERGARLFAMLDILGTNSNFTIWMQDKNTTLFKPATTEEFTKFKALCDSNPYMIAVSLYRRDVISRGLLAQTN